MRIVRFSSPSAQTYNFQDQKISLSKLTQVRALATGQHKFQKSSNISNANSFRKVQSHIKWQPQQSIPSIVLHQVNNIVPVQHVSKSPKRIPRKKIFQPKDSNVKQNVQIPTFSQMPSMNYVGDQETQFYSMIVGNSPKQQSKNYSRQYQSPFHTNQENSRIDSRVDSMNSHHMFGSSTNVNSIEKSSILELTQHHIPRLEQKLKDHDQQLATIKKYLKNTSQINNLKQSMKQYHEIQTLLSKEKQIQMKRQLLQRKLQKIKEADLRQNSQRLKQQEQAERKIQHIQEERLRRLEKIQLQNQKLYQNLKSHQFQDFDPEQNYQQEYRFQGPVAFPSKDWQSQRQIMMPSSEGFNRTSTPKDNLSYQKGYRTGEVQISPVLKRKMNEISSIGISGNRTESFSLQGNTFREIMSPLQFQGQHEDGW